MSTSSRFLDLPLELQFSVLNHCIPRFSIQISHTRLTICRAHRKYSDDIYVSALGHGTIKNLLWIPRQLRGDLKRLLLVCFDRQLGCGLGPVQHDFLNFTNFVTVPWSLIKVLDLQSPAGNRGRTFARWHIFYFFWLAVAPASENECLTNLRTIKGRLEFFIPSFDLPDLNSDSTGKAFLAGALDRDICAWFHARMRLLISRIRIFQWGGHERLEVEIEMNLKFRD